MGEARSAAAPEATGKAAAHQKQVRRVQLEGRQGVAKRLPKGLGLSRGKTKMDHVHRSHVPVLVHPGQQMATDRATDARTKRNWQGQAERQIALDSPGAND